MTNYEFIKEMDSDTLAMFLRMSGHHIGGWSYMELIKWLSEEDNISKDLTEEKKQFYEIHG